MIGGAEAAPAHEPFGADERKERDRLLRGDLKSEFEMVLQVLANPWPVGEDVDPERSQFLRRPHTRQLQQLRRIDRPPAKYDLAPRPCRLLATAAPVADPDCATPIEGDPS